MTEFPQIFKTDIINAETDAFWHENAQIDADMHPKDVLILSADIAPGSTEETQFKKIMDACKLTEADYNLIHCAENDKRAWHSLKHRLTPTKVILFGINPKQLSITAMFRLNGTNNYDGAVIIPTLSLQELEQQQQAKKDLWLHALKPVFADK